MDAGQNADEKESEEGDEKESEEGDEKESEEGDEKDEDEFEGMVMEGEVIANPDLRLQSTVRYDCALAC